MVYSQRTVLVQQEQYQLLTNSTDVHVEIMKLEVFQRHLCPTEEFSPMLRVTLFAPEPLRDERQYQGVEGDPLRFRPDCELRMDGLGNARNELA